MKYRIAGFILATAIVYAQAQLSFEGASIKPSNSARTSAPSANPSPANDSPC
jgi:hypothetical protein